MLNYPPWFVILKKTLCNSIWYQRILYFSLSYFSHDESIFCIILPYLLDIPSIWYQSILYVYACQSSLRYQSVLYVVLKYLPYDIRAFFVMYYSSQYNFNAGKTSLIKALTGEVLLMPRNQLFATLDVTVHEGRLPSHRKVLYVDTVGFISNIPTALVASFKSTLDDAIDAVSIMRVLLLKIIK